MLDTDEYRSQFQEFVLGKLKPFYESLGDWYEERGGSRDSLSYFRNHFPRFEAMLKLCAEHIVNPLSVCEIGSFYPYTAYYFRAQGAAYEIDLYDIILRELKGPAEPYDVDGVRLIDFNLCTERLPDKLYDLVIVSEVMEHLPINLFKFEKELERLVVPGGYMLVTYPLGGRNAKDYEKEYPARDFERLQEDHVREFTVSTVPLFFKAMEEVARTQVTYRAYGRIMVVLYRRPAA